MQRLSQGALHEAASCSGHSRQVQIPRSRRLVSRLSRRSQHVLAFATAPSPSPALAAVPSVVERANSSDTLKPLPRAVESLADDPSLHNPLERMERLGTGWFGAIVEYEGVLVEDTGEYHNKAWLAVADEFGLPRPLGHLFRRIKGVRDELVGRARCLQAAWLPIALISPRCQPASPCPDPRAPRVNSACSLAA